MSQKWGEPLLIRQGFIALGLGLLIIPLANSVELLLIAMAIVTYGFSLASPALSSHLSLQVAAEEQGIIFGIGRSASTLARALGPAGSGYVFAFLGKDWPFFIGAILMLLVLILSFIVNKFGDKFE